MKQSFTLLFVLVIVNFTLAQKDYAFVEVNYNTFGHSLLKQFQEEFITDLSEFPVQINDNFPRIWVLPSAIM